MKYSLLALAIGVSAETPIPVCYGLDPYRTADDSLNHNMGAFKNADDCINSCKEYGNGCEVVNWNKGNGSCWGYNKYSGSCSLDNEWTTYYTVSEDASQGASNTVQPVPICRGWDPARVHDSLNVHLGKFSTIQKCTFACEAKDGCEVVNYDNNGSCWGYNTYSGQCETAGTWNTYAISNTKWSNGASESDITEMWGDVDMIHFVYKGACIQIKGNDVKEHEDLA